MATIIVRKGPKPPKVPLPRGGKRTKAPVLVVAKATPVPTPPTVPRKGQTPAVKPFRGNPPRIP